MRFDRLRLCGFKSFVEPVDIEIQPGLTGVVGPNGCGKSNLVEGLRWLMGANSAKAMRAGGMDEVIFAGTTGGRPARSWAEVTLEIDNSERRAPAQFNDNDTLVVSRRVTRRADGSMSTYRINDKEVRARDVQMLFADASTGATSPALVRQGQISELINAKPSERRRFLEEAAGVTGLAARRHEAQLRLKAAGDNLERLDDVIGELDAQSEALARQARKAAKYRVLSDEIKELSKRLTAARIAAAHMEHRDIERRLSERRTALADIVSAAASADRAATEAAAKVTEARGAERVTATAMTEAAAALRGFENERTLRETARKERAARLEKLTDDITRETALLSEATSVIASAETAIRELHAELSTDTETRGQLEEAALVAEQASSEAEKRFDEIQAAAAEQRAEIRAAQQASDEAERRLKSAQANVARIAEKLAALPQIDMEAAATAEAKAKTAAEAHIAAKSAHEAADTALEAARQKSQAADIDVREARRALDLLEKEVSVLLPLIPQRTKEESGESLLSNLSAPEELRAALASILGDALHAAVGSGDHAFTGLGAKAIAVLPLPAGATRLSELLEAPAELSRHLAFIGIIEGAPTDDQLTSLQPGQILVNADGGLWRWDGYKRLGGENKHLEELLSAAARLTALEADREATQARLAQATAEADEARATLERAQVRVRTARELETAASKAEKDTAASSARLAQEHQATQLQRTNLEDQHTEVTAALAEAEERHRSVAQMAVTEPTKDSVVDEAREKRDEARRIASSARGKAAEHRRKAEQRREALRTQDSQLRAWTERKTATSARLDALRAEKTELESQIGRDEPEQTDDGQGEALELSAEETKRKWERSRDVLAEAERVSTEADKLRRETEAKAAAEREATAELGAELRAAKTRLDEAVSETGLIDVDLDAFLADAGEESSTDELQTKLQRVEKERERLGAVNLLAAEEKSSVDERLDTLRRERSDCEDASNQLQTAVNAINREGRQRLVAAFESVNGHFRVLFTGLFGGGEAHLKFVDNDDPLAAGLEIFAQPPGKKLQSLSLMSGGEQALTATALIFAAFKTNPAPICVLDEVDAPLDDANVERFCDLLSTMARSSATRFLVVTHHPLTMSRMDRLFGVTMMERGVSRLFGLDLESARRLAA